MSRRRPYGRRLGGVGSMRNAMERGDPRKFRPWGLVHFSRGDLGISLNGGDVSAQADFSGAGNDVAQGVGANQPLWVASLQNNRSCVQYTSANNDVLSKANVNLFGTGNYTALYVVRCSDSAAVKAMVSNISGAGGPTWRKDASNNRSPTHVNVGAGSDGAQGTTPEIQLLRFTSGVAVQLFVNGASQAVGTPPTTLADPGATAVLALGAEWVGAFQSWASQDLYLTALFTSDVGASVQRRLERGCAGRYALAI